MFIADHIYQVAAIGSPKIDLDMKNIQSLKYFESKPVCLSTNILLPSFYSSFASVPGFVFASPPSSSDIEQMTQRFTVTD